MAASTTFRRNQPFRYDAFGYSGALVNLGSHEYVKALLRFGGWVLFALSAPVLVALGTVFLMNWTNFRPAMYTSLPMHGAPLAFLVFCCVALFVLTTMVVAGALLLSFFGMLAAFEKDVSPSRRYWNLPQK